MNRLRTYWSDRSGAAAIEFAIVGSAFILLSLGIVDIGRNFVIVHQLNHLADQISRAVMLDTQMSPADLQAYAQANWKGHSPETLSLRLDNQIVEGIPSERFELSYAIVWIIPLGENSILRVQRALPSR
jgi:Flp pilus assembly protein TadG